MIVPVMSTSICFTASKMMASRVAMAAVPPNISVHRHRRRETVILGPPAGQVLGGALRGADTTAEARRVM